MIFNVDYIFHLVVKSLEGGQQIFGEFLLGDDKLSFNLTDTIDHPILAQVGVEGYYSVVVPGKDQIDKSRLMGLWSSLLASCITSPIQIQFSAVIN